jgi:hypothetical protein
MSEENVEVVRRSFEGISQGRPVWELYADDFQLVNLPDPPWQPSRGAKGLPEYRPFFDNLALPPVLVEIPGARGA